MSEIVLSVDANKMCAFYAEWAYRMQKKARKMGNTRSRHWLKRRLELIGDIASVRIGHYVRWDSGKYCVPYPNENHGSYNYVVFSK
jgi:hypothetical protein